MKKNTIATTSVLAGIAAITALACGRTEDAATTAPDGVRTSLFSRHTAPSAPDRLLQATARAPLARRASANPTPLAATSTDGPIPPRYQAFATAFDAERQSLGAPGAAVAILEHGQVTFAHGFGTKSSTSTAPVDARTLFRVGSLTKSLTAVGFMSTVDDGRASVDEKFTSLVPDVALSGDDLHRLTMRDLLSQQSGLFDFTNDSTNPAVTTDICPTDPGALESFVTGTLFGQNEFFMAPPGALWNYSNTNYTLVGAALEKAAGTDYATAMNERVFRPLGMTRTFFDPSLVLADGDYSDGLSTNDDGSPLNVEPDSYDCGWYRPAGFAFTNVEDYAKYMQLLYAGAPHVLPDASLEAIEAPQVDTYVFANTTYYGFGIETRTGIDLASGYYATRILTHEGGIPGFVAHFILAPETGFGMVILSNADGADFWNSIDLGFRSFSGLPERSAQPVSLDPPTKVNPLFAGTYLDTTGQLGTMIITDQGGALNISMPLLDAQQVSYAPTLTPNAEYDYLVTIEGEQILLTFVPGRDGRYTWLLVNESWDAERVTPDAGP